MRNNIIVHKKYILKILSPIHIGYGEVLDPFKFVIDDKLMCVYILNIDKFLQKLSPDKRDKLIGICDKSTPYSIIEIYNFMSSQLSLIKNNMDMVVRKIEISRDFLEHFNSVKNLSKERSNEINRFMIYLLSHCQNIKAPIIPGSSIKGAIRTAIINFYANSGSLSSIDGLRREIYRANRKSLNRLAPKLEKKILNYSDAKDDAMKVLKVSDFMPRGHIKTKIIYAFNMRKDGTRPSVIPQLFEVIEQGAEFEGTISILKMNKGYVDKINFEVMDKSLKIFYKKIFEKEEPSVLASEGDGYIMKLGRHSGAEAMTIEGFRRIWIKGRGKSGSWRDCPTTEWIVSDKRRAYMGMPFAWVELIPEDNRLKNTNKPLKKDVKTQIKSKKTTVKRELDISTLAGKFRIRKK